MAAKSSFYAVSMKYWAKLHQPGVGKIAIIMKQYFEVRVGYNSLSRDILNECVSMSEG